MTTEIIDASSELQTLRARQGQLKSMIGQIALFKASSCDRFTSLDLGNGRKTPAKYNTSGLKVELPPGEYEIAGVGTVGFWAELKTPTSDNVAWIVGLEELKDATAEEIAERQA